MDCLADCGVELLEDGDGDLDVVGDFWGDLDFFLLIPPIGKHGNIVFLFCGMKLKLNDHNMCNNV